VRVYPGHEELLATQLRALARASAGGPVRVMVPMVARAEELAWVRERLTAVQAELAAAGVPFDAAMQLGAMVEVPAAAFALEELARVADFFSVGTNDLLQYAFAADRGNPRVAGPDARRSPAFLRLLAKIVQDAHAGGRPVAMCGEMASEAKLLPLLVGLGFDELSMAPSAVPRAKAALAGLEADACRTLALRALGASDEAAVDALLAAHRGASAGGLLDPALVLLDADACTKEEAIAELVAVLEESGRVEDAAALEGAIWAREEAYSTGLGHGFAVPHAKTDAVGASSIALLRLAAPVAWGAADEEPVRCVILLALRASEDEGEHMRVFSRLARWLVHDDFRARLLDAPDPDTVLACLADEPETPR